MKTYFISGIAADERLFRHINLPSGFEPFYLKWEKPFANESLQTYAYRLADKINTDEPFLLIGTSLGGIIATEIALKFKPLAVIIIGSVPSISQLPGYYRIVEKLKIHKILTGSVYKFSGRVKHYFTRENPDDKRIIIQMISETDPAFISWGINAVLKWRNTQIPKSLYHIHGTRDEVFPFAFTSPTHIMPKGDHVIVMNRAREINNIIAEIFSNLKDKI